MPHKTACATLF